MFSRPLLHRRTISLSIRTMPITQAGILRLILVRGPLIQPGPPISEIFALPIRLLHWEAPQRGRSLSLILSSLVITRSMPPGLQVVIALQMLLSGVFLVGFL